MFKFLVPLISNSHFEIPVVGQASLLASVSMLPVCGAGMVEWCSWNRGAEQKQELTTPNPSLERRGALKEWGENGSAALRAQEWCGNEKAVQEW